MLLHPLVPVSHEQADSGGTDAQSGDAVLLHHAPQPGRVWIVRGALHHDHGAAQGCDSYDHPGAHHPADVRYPEEYVLRLQVEAVSDLLGGLDQDAYVCVDGTFRPAGGAAGVQDHGAVLTVQLPCLELIRLAAHEIRPCHVPRIAPWCLSTKALQDHDPRHAGDQIRRPVRLLLQLHDLSPSGVAVCGE